MPPTKNFSRGSLSNWYDADADLDADADADSSKTICYCFLRQKVKQSRSQVMFFMNFVLDDYTIQSQYFFNFIYLSLLTQQDSPPILVTQSQEVTGQGCANICFMMIITNILQKTFS